MMRKTRWIGLTLIGFMVVLGSWLLFQPNNLVPETETARKATADLVGLSGLDRETYISGEGVIESQLRPTMGDYWAHRVSYPTGRFSPEWVVEAAEADQRLAQATPLGQHVLVRAEGGLNIDPSQFTSLGPKPLNMSSYGHVGGRTNVIVSNPLTPSIAYFGSDGGGVWRSTDCCDANTTWSPVTDDSALFSSIAIGDITLDPNDPNVVYAGTGDLRYGSWSFGSTGILKSTDGGDTWEIKGEDVFIPYYDRDDTFPQYQAIGKVRVDPRNSDNVVATTKTGVFFSYDAGDTWDGPCLPHNFETERQDGTALILIDGGTETTVIVGIGSRGIETTMQPDLDQNGGNGIYRTILPANGCPASWELISRPDNGWPAGTGSGTAYPTNTLGRIDMAIAPSDPDIMYVQVQSIPTPGLLGIWRTLDGGDTWEQRSNASGLTGCDGDRPQNWYNQGLAIDPNDPDVVFQSAVDLFRSTNGGTTFVNMTCGYAGGYVHVDHHALAYVDGDSDTLLVGSDGGAYLTSNATVSFPDFTQLNDTVSTIEFYSGDITANFAYDDAPGVNAGAQDNGSSVYVWDGETVGPAVWSMRTGGDGMYARIEQMQGQRWYQESQFGNLKVSTSGPNGSFFNASGAWGGDRLSFIFPYEMQKYDCETICDHMIAGSYRVWETVQGAIPSNSWYVNSPDLTKNTLGNRSFINQLSYAVSDSSIAIVGTNDGNVQYGFNMGQGSANTATWVDVTDGNAVLPNRPIQDVTTHPTIPTIGLAAVGGFNQNTPSTPGHVFQVTCDADCGSFTWEDKSGNLPNVPINSILANPNLPNQVFAGSDWGLYYTDDISVANPVWMKFMAGLPSTMIWDMSIDRGFTTLALFTRSRGAFVWPLPVSPYAATLSPTSSESGKPLESVTHSFVLNNVGDTDSYMVSIDAGSWETTLLTPETLTVTGGTTETISVEVMIDGSATLSDADMFTLTVVSMNDSGNITLQAMGETTAVGTASLLTPTNLPTLSGGEGEVVTHTINVTNTGDISDTFTVEVVDGLWETAVSPNVITLAPNQQGVIYVAVTVGAKEESDTTTLTMTSMFDGTVTESVTFVTELDGYVIYLPLVAQPER